MRDRMLSVAQRNMLAEYLAKKVLERPTALFPRGDGRAYANAPRMAITRARRDAGRILDELERLGLLTPTWEGETLAPLFEGRADAPSFKWRAGEARLRARAGKDTT